MGRVRKYKVNGRTYTFENVQIVGGKMIEYCPKLKSTAKLYKNGFIIPGQKFAFVDIIK